MTDKLSLQDLQAAVDAGVIDAEQAAKLRAMRRNGGGEPAEQLGPDGEPALLSEERFRFLNGFNDVFLTIGVLLVAGAFVFAAAPSFSGRGWVGVLAFAALIFWVLSEILVARLRAVLPGMVLAFLFCTFAATAVASSYYWRQLGGPGWDVFENFAFWRQPTLLFAVPALVAALAFYGRFKLPFTLALVACFGYIVLRKLVELPLGTAPSSNLAFFYGIFVLGAALAYDARDPKRLSRLSDCAFWLHLVAAPMIVSPVIHAVKVASGGAGTSLFVLATVLILGAFALAIDRRALLVSSLIYFTIAVYDILSGGTDLPVRGGMPSSFVLTLATVGMFVLVLGVFWQPLRRRLLPWLVPARLAPYVPPAAR